MKLLNLDDKVYKYDECRNAMLHQILRDRHPSTFSKRKKKGAGQMHAQVKFHWNEEHRSSKLKQVSSFTDRLGKSKRRHRYQRSETLEVQPHNSRGLLCFR